LNCLKTWILDAQYFSVDESVTEIIGANDILVGLLEAMYSNTPKDLITSLGQHPKLLFETWKITLKTKMSIFMIVIGKRMHLIGLIEPRLS